MKPLLKLLAAITLLFHLCFTRIVIEPQLNHYAIRTTAPNGNEWAIVIWGKSILYVSPEMAKTHDCI